VVKFQEKLLSLLRSGGKKKRKIRARSLRQEIILTDREAGESSNKTKGGGGGGGREQNAARVPWQKKRGIGLIQQGDRNELPDKTESTPGTKRGKRRVLRGAAR